MPEKSGVFQPLYRTGGVLALELRALVSKSRLFSLFVKAFAERLKALDLHEFAVQEFLLRLEFCENTLCSSFALQGFVPQRLYRAHAGMDVPGLAVGALQLTFESDYARRIRVVEAQCPQKLALCVRIPQRAWTVLVTEDDVV